MEISDPRGRARVNAGVVIVTGRFAKIEGLSLWCPTERYCARAFEKPNLLHLGLCIEASGRYGPISG
jgi:hypothetical protein